MDLKTCYTQLGGDYDAVMGRMRREQMVAKFVLKFLGDKSYDLFEASMREQNYEEALRAVHTLKGICQNLSFTQLYETSDLITSALKAGDVAKAAEMAPQLARDYDRVVCAVKEYGQSAEG